MSLIIATGSNQGNPVLQLQQVQNSLSQLFHFQAASRIYLSKAVDYEAQPDFHNQVLQFAIPLLGPQQVLLKLLQVESEMGRVRDVWRGPRVIDLDIIFGALKATTQSS